MAKQPGPLTYEAVARLADEIAKSGVTPSQRALIEQLGGSYSTMGPFLRQWKAARAAANAAGLGKEPPRYIGVDIAVAAEVKRAQDDVRQELQSDLEEQGKEIEQLTNALDAARAHGSQHEATGVELQRQVAQLSGQLEEVRRELEAAKLERAKSSAALEELRGQHGQVVEAKAGLEARVVELLEESNRNTVAMRALEQRTAEAVAGRAVAEQNMSTLKSELEASLLVERKARTEAEHRALSLLATVDSHAAKLERLAGAEAAERILREQVATLNGQVTSLTALLQQGRQGMMSNDHPASQPAAPGL